MSSLGLSNLLTRVDGHVEGQYRWQLLQNPGGQVASTENNSTGTPTWDDAITPIRSMGRTGYLPTWLVVLFIVNVGKYSIHTSVWEKKTVRLNFESKLIPYILYLVAGFNPFEKYARQIGCISPIFRGKNQKIFELPPPRCPFVTKTTFLLNVWSLLGVLLTRENLHKHSAKAETEKPHQYGTSRTTKNDVVYYKGLLTVVVPLRWSY